MKQKANLKMKKEQLQQHHSLRETEFSSDVFYNQMLKAFKHGREFEHLDTNGFEIDIANANDKNLPFSEWFNKYFRIPISEEVLLEKGWSRAGITCARNEFGIRNELNQFLKRILVENGVFTYIDSGKEIKWSYELDMLKYLLTPNTKTIRVMKQKTPLLEAIEQIKQSGWLDTQSKMVAVGILTELLPKEKDVIEEAYVDGCLENIDLTQPIECEKYFNETFIQK